jgi:transcriptional regulator with XRE-family HTH domain
VSIEKDCQAVCARIIRLLREERGKRGLTKYVVAHRSGLSQQAVGYMERGEKRPSLETILRYAAAIEADFADIVRRARVESPQKRRK